MLTFLSMRSESEKIVFKFFQKKKYRESFLSMKKGILINIPFSLRSCYPLGIKSAEGKILIAATTHLGTSAEGLQL